MNADGLMFGFVVGVGCMCVVGIVVAETRRPDIKHPPTLVRVLAKSEHRPREGRTGFELQFGAAGYVGNVWVDRIVYDAATHWSCIAVRYNEDQHSWEYVRASTRCEP